MRAAGKEAEKKTKTVKWVRGQKLFQPELFNNVVLLFGRDTKCIMMTSWKISYIISTNTINSVGIQITSWVKDTRIKNLEKKGAHSRPWWELVFLFIFSFFLWSTQTNTSVDHHLLVRFPFKFFVVAIEGVRYSHITQTRYTEMAKLFWIRGASSTQCGGLCLMWMHVDVSKLWEEKKEKVCAIS